MNDIIKIANEIANSTNNATNFTNIQSNLPKTEQQQKDEVVKMIYKKHLQAQEWGNKLNQELEPSTSTNKHRHEKSRRKKKDVFDWIGGAVKDSVNWIGEAAKDTGKAICQGAKKAVDFDSSARKTIQSVATDIAHEAEIGGVKIDLKVAANKVGDVYNKVEQIKKDALNTIC